MRELLQFWPVVLSIIAFIAWLARLEFKLMVNAGAIAANSASDKEEREKLHNELTTSVDRIRIRSEEQIRDIKLQADKQDAEIRHLAKISTDIAEIKTHLSYLRTGFERLDQAKNKNS